MKRKKQSEKTRYGCYQIGGCLPNDLILAVAEIVIIAVAFLSGIAEGMLTEACDWLKD